VAGWADSFSENGGLDVLSAAVLAVVLPLVFFIGYRLGAHRARRANDATSVAPAASINPEELVRQAAAAERERIYADLHDDLGARLLELIYAAPDRAMADQARAILQDLRDVVSRSRSEPGTLSDVLASIRGEAEGRLRAVGIALAWEEIDTLPEPALDQATALHLHRIVREAISNAIRHANARRLRVRVAVDARAHLQLELTDEGDAPTPAIADRSGSGLRNMRDRAEALQGDIRWSAGTLGGTKVLLQAPLPKAAPA